MTSEIKADEFIDEELQRFGVRFTDATMQGTCPVVDQKAPKVKAPRQEKQYPVAEHEPVPKYAPNWYERLKGCAKWAVTFGALCCVFFYWQQTGLMAPEAAVPSMCVCNLLVGWGVGKNVLK